MTDKKITDLTNIVAADLVDADEFVVVDISADETMALTLGELKTAVGGGAGDLLAANNLSDLADAATSRTNLGLGTAATTASADYATAAQGTTADAALPKAGGAMSGAITTTSTFDGRDVATDGTKLDGIESGANVTDTANVTAAGALMDSELTAIASVKALNQGVATTDSPTFAGLTVDTDTLHVDAANNRVGIGTDNPSYTLDVQGTGDTIARIYTGGTTSSDDAMLFLGLAGTTATNRINFGDADDADRGRIIYGHSGDYMSFTTAASEAMRIDSSGNVGIGTSSPATALDVTGTVTATTVDLGNWTVTESSGVLHFATGGVNKMKLDATGNLTVVGNVTAYGTI